jgi:hypothetical protein
VGLTRLARGRRTTAQLSWTALGLTAAYAAAAAALWLGYGVSHSVGGGGGWGFARVDDLEVTHAGGHRPGYGTGVPIVAAAHDAHGDGLSLSPADGAVLVPRPGTLQTCMTSSSSLTSLLGAASANPVDGSSGAAA